jgi:hypothetical protein
VVPIPSGSASAGPVGPGAPAACQSANVRLAFTGNSGAGGRSYASYTLTNAGTSRCTLTQPSATYANSSGATVKSVAQAGGGANVVLAPAGVAGFSISDSSCQQPLSASQLVVTLPGSSPGLTVAGQYQVCSPAITSIAAA